MTTLTTAQRTALTDIAQRGGVIILGHDAQGFYSAETMQAHRELITLGYARLSEELTYLDEEQVKITAAGIQVVRTGETAQVEDMTPAQVAEVVEAAQEYGREIAINNIVTKDLILGAYSDFIFFWDTDIRLDVLKAHEGFIVDQIAIGAQL